MKRAHRVLLVLLVVFALAGMALSFALIQEFYGVASGAVKSVCTSSHTGVNSCRTVAESAYSALRGIPIIGEIPVAAAGFAFYGFMAALFLRSLFSGDVIRLRGSFALGAVLSLTAVAGNLVLLYLSVAVIRAVCPLCSYTYIANAILLMLSLAGWFSARERGGDGIAATAIASVRTGLVPYAVTALVLLTAGIASAQLSKRAFDARLSESATDEQVRALISLYRSTAPVAIDLDGSPRLGPANATVRIVIYMDFTCDHCRDAGNTLSDLRERWPDKITIIYKNYPLDGPCTKLDRGHDDNSAGACIAAVASLCSWRLGKYPDVYRALYDNSERGVKHTQTSVREIARRCGLAQATFESCIQSKETADIVARDVAEGDRLGIDGTPRVYINGRLVPNDHLGAPVLSGLMNYLTN